MKIIDNFFDKMHNNYLKKVKTERNEIKNWTNGQIKGYLEAYFNHGFSEIRNLFGESILGEPPIIEACIEVQGQRVTSGMYNPPY